MTEEELDRRCYNRERFKEEAALGVYDLMEKLRLNRSEFAARIGRSRAFVTKILSGCHNFTLDTLADIFISLGRYPHFSLGVAPFEVRSPVDEAKYGVSIAMPPWTEDEWVESWNEPALRSGLGLT